ncbi:glycosyltransferase family 2 protein [Escherichia coli]|uniref:glycosyltransferase family 2 protein n=1 Tax=Escherichia coli TaxID=562 RepID=UPI00201A6188|nr:glycosyltransferase family 2 protein [Escherichia coli]
MDAKIEASIVIPVYNSSSYIIETIESVALSCYGISFEIILVDDVSDDIENLRAIIQKYSYVRLIEKHIKSNASESRNIGIRNAQYNHIFLLDADDFFTKEYVKHRLDLMQRKNCGVFFGAYNAVSPNGVVNHIFFNTQGMICETTYLFRVEIYGLLQYLLIDYIIRILFSMKNNGSTKTGVSE